MVINTKLRDKPAHLQNSSPISTILLLPFYPSLNPRSFVNQYSCKNQPRIKKTRKDESSWLFKDKTSSECMLFKARIQLTLPLRYISLINYRKNNFIIKIFFTYRPAPLKPLIEVILFSASSITELSSLSLL